MLKLIRGATTVIKAETAVGRPLYVVIAVMCYLASLGVGTTVYVNDIADTWASGLSGAITVQIKPSEKMSVEDQLDRTLTILKSTPGLYGIRPLSREESENLLDPWLGKDNLPDTLNLPRIIDVRIDVKSPPDLTALRQRLKANVDQVVLDDHFHWKNRLLAFAGSLQGMTLAALGLILLSTVATVIFATRAAMAANREVVEVLHLVGARDNFIASEFQAHFLRLGVVSGLMGALAAAGTLMLMGVIAGSDAEMGRFLPTLALQWWAYPALLFIPTLSAVVAMLTARYTALDVIGNVL